METSVTYSFKDTALSYVEHGGEDRYLAPVVEYFGDRALASIAPFDIRQMALELYKDHSNSTRNRQGVTPARAVILHGYDRGWGPLIRVRRFKVEPATRKEPASVTWMTLFLRQCVKDELLPLAALVLFMNQTGSRISEAIRLEWSEVDLTKREVVLLKTKTSTFSRRALTDELVIRFNLLDKTSKRVFGYTCRHSVNDRMKAVCERAGISYKSPHLVGRHSFATNAMNSGIDIKRVMEAGDWKSVEVFLNTYVHVHDAARSVADRFNAVRYDVNL